MRRAKIVATLGPATSSYESLLAIIEAGVDVARMNLSHGTYDVHEEVYKNVRRAAADAGKSVAVMVDLQGPKIRLGKFENGPYDLAEGDIFKITIDDIIGNKDISSTTFKGLPGDVKPGDPLLIDDGKVGLRVLETDGTVVTTVVEVPGPISNNKGINLPGVAVNVPALSEKDEADLRWGLRLGADYIALSFVRDASDIVRVHAIMDEEGVRLPVIAKIEKPQAVENLEAIVDAFDAIMVARGDLGV
jgi:pyruvate kinase